MIAADFTYSDNFTGLTPVQTQNAINVIEAVYSGILLCWDKLPYPVRTNKRITVENLLVAWYLANFFPSKVRGVVSNGGLPLSSKSIGGTSVSFENINVQQGLDNLKTNVFGLQALSMIQSAPEMLTIYG